MTPDLRAAIERAEKVADYIGKHARWSAVGWDAIFHETDLRILLDAVKGLERDAERYRWLRKPGADNREVTILVGDDPPGLLKNETAWYGYSGEALDAAIDAALAEEQP